MGSRASMLTSGSIESARAEVLERGGELRRIRSLIDRAAGGVGAVLCVEGEAGIGKTAMLQETRAMAERAGLAVLSARGGELERDFAHGVARQLYEPELRHAPAGRRRRLLAGAAAAAAPLLGLANPQETAVGSGTDATFAANHGLYWLTADLAEERPLVLVVDDAHWADSASLLFLNYLGRRIDELPVLLAVAVRPAEPGAHQELLDTLHGLEQTERLTPLALSEGATATLVARALGPGHGPELTRACHEMTGGNPFLLTELLRALVADEVELGADAAGRVRRVGPRSISQGVLGRLATLWPEAHALARAVAVLDTDAELHHAAALAGLEQRAAESAADALAQAQVLAPGRPLRFLHPILRQAVYLDMPEGRRAGDHARAARVLHERGSPERASVHLLACEPAADAWAVELLRTAAARNLAAGSPGTATLLLERALAEPPSTADRPTVLLELGRAERIAGEPAAVEHLREALVLIADPPLRAKVTAELAVTLAQHGEIVEAVGLVERALGDFEVDEETGLELETTLFGLSQLSDELAARAASRVDRLAGLAGDTPAQRLALAAVSSYKTMFALGTAAELADVARRALGDGKLVSEAASENPLVGGPIQVLSLAAPAEARELLTDAIAEARTRGSALGFAMASTQRARVEYMVGNLVRAEADARSALEAISSSSSYGLLIVYVVSALVSVLTTGGQLEDAERTLAAHGLDSEAPPTTAAGSALLRSRSWLRLAQGRVEEAVNDARAALEGERRRGGLSPRSVFDFGALPALLAGGHLQEARKLAAEELSVAERVQAPNCIGVALIGEGLVAGGGPGIALLERSVHVLESTSNRLDLARALVELGAALRRANRRSDAREPLRRGMELAHHCGAAPLAERARQELVACGARPRRPVRTGIDSLTATERRVAELAANGMSNPEIAQALFVSRRTIETHLGHSYAKLDIRSREQLADQLKRAD